MATQVVKKKIQVEGTFVDKIKKNWKNILLIILLLFSLSKCTSSCNRANQIEKLNYQIEQRDSIIRSNGIEMDLLTTRLSDAQESNNAYKGIATGNQKELINRIESLSDENRKLNSKVSSLNSENSKLKGQVSELEKKIKELSEESK